MSDQTLIELKEISKVYRIWRNPHERLTGGLHRRLGDSSWLPPLLRSYSRKQFTKVCKEFYALKNVGFKVGKGESVGIIGKNGSGKSTTLKIIAGTLTPSSGSVSVNGRVAAMLELTAGFEQEFTGRENVFLSASILGISKAEIRSKYAEIEAFADIGDFIDQPVHTYSSGMLLRLAFSVHTAVNPEILIIDEALSVGDETFRRKCYARLEALKKKGTTLLFVSHDLGTVVNLTERALFFHQGEVIMEGEPKPVVETYQRYSHGSREQMEEIAQELKAGRELSMKASVPVKGLQQQTEVSEPRPEKKKGNLTGEGFDPNFKSKSIHVYEPRGGEISDLQLTTLEGEPVNILERRKRYKFAYKVSITETSRDVTFAMLIKSMKGLELGGGRILPWDTFIPTVEKGEIYQLEFEFETLLMPGVYFLNAGAEGVVEGQRSYIHRIFDGIVFRVLREDNLMPTGNVDFLIEPKMKKIQG